MFFLEKEYLQLFSQLREDEKSAILFILKKFATLKESKQRLAQALRQQKKE